MYRRQVCFTQSFWRKVVFKDTIRGFRLPQSTGYNGRQEATACSFHANVGVHQCAAHKEMCFIAISARWTRNVWQVGVTDDMRLRWYLVSDWGLNTVAGFSQPCRGKGLFCYSFTKARLEGDVSCRIKLAMCKVTSSGHWVLHKWLQGSSLDLFLIVMLSRKDNFINPVRLWSEVWGFLEKYTSGKSESETRLLCWN